jgi:REP element-mobilizing transposase RayT
MGHTYTSQLLHCVFSTKNRLPLLSAEIRPRLHAYLGGVARENEMKALAVGGVEDHVHILLSLKATMPLSKAMQLIKGGSSLWMHETFPQITDFAWQEGYGAFSVGISQIDDTIAYIARQEEHHRKVSFQDEYRAILKRHGIEWDERYIWG